MNNPNVDQAMDYTDQITIYYNPEINRHEKTVVHAKGNAEVLAISFDKMPEAYNVWMRIWEALEDNPNRIFDEKHPKYKSLIDGQITNFEDWRNIALHHRDMIAHPIAMNNEQIIVCERQTQVYELIQPAT